MKKIIVSLVAVLALAGCSNDATTAGTPSGVSFSTVVVQHEGKPLTCVVQGRAHGGPSCDWVRYHHENGF